MSRTTTAPKDFDGYISAFPEDVQAILRKIRTTIRREARGAEETIRYGMPAFILNGPLVYFAAYKRHIGLYPAPGGSEKFNRELASYRAARSSVRFPLNKPIPFGLIRQIVRLRIKENTKQGKARLK